MNKKSCYYELVMKNNKVLVAVAWPYVNGDIHIGHLAGYLLPADIYARFNRLLGNEVLMVSGSDCYGTPITIEADKRRVSPAEIVKEYHERNRGLFFDTLNLSFDIYTKTTTENHHKIVQDFFVGLVEKDLVFKKETNQYFSEKEKRFLPDRYVEGTCPKCGYKEARSDQCDRCGSLLEQGELLSPRSKTDGVPIVLKSTEHYFLDWPKLTSFLEGYVASREDWRDWVLNETKGWLKEGLKPRAITRDIEWGVPIPTDRLPKNLRIEGSEHKRIYVWFEAVIGYLSATVEWATINGREWRDFWYGGDITHSYFMGKDNLVFHTLFWPGELYGYADNIHLPDQQFVNQFLNLEGKKFSKSRGVIIDSKYMVEKYGLDVVRFYLISINPESADANFSWGDFVAKVNDVLIGNLGNFVNRTLVLGEGLLPLDEKNFKLDISIRENIKDVLGGAQDALKKGLFRKYLDFILELSDFGNKYLSEHEPWKFKSSDPERFRLVIKNALFMVEAIRIISAPLLPNASERLSLILGLSSVSKWPSDGISEYISSQLSKAQIKKVVPLFQKIDLAVIEEERSKITGEDFV